MTPIGLFMQAGLVGKAVIIVLLVMSIWCWVLILEGWVGLIRLRSAVRRLHNGGRNHISPLLLPIIEAGETARRIQVPMETAGEKRQRIGEAMRRAAQVLLGRLDRGLPSLAVISSVAPFIGLFGTVWGIMTSFASIADANDTSLAVVAPGIAEALAATAIGLAAAIPASMGYNRLSSAIGRVAQSLDHVIEDQAVALMVRSAPVHELHREREPRNGHVAAQ
ncbi:MAG: MotA/TolQ/ExbB proton channel family protein [Hyphomicrobiaceae bacterium]|jgi:Biopolymer transport proteins|nr:MAG: flagellar motor protein MotA [Pseudomonadota bacterium]